MNFWDIRDYAETGNTLEKAEKLNFKVTTIKIQVSADRTVEIRTGSLSDNFNRTISKALKAEQKHIKDSLIRLINNAD